mmetsp:Transcript_30253/g.68713  ORF Transcript_30253/g.68713 Transcript_30253/m.68713 type:complete len:368 (-) Transcript_30253:434-1537(-)
MLWRGSSLLHRLEVVAVVQTTLDHDRTESGVDDPDSLDGQNQAIVRVVIEHLPHHIQACKVVDHDLEQHRADGISHDEYSHRLEEARYVLRRPNAEVRGADARVAVGVRAVVHDQEDDHVGDGNDDLTNLRGDEGRLPDSDGPLHALLRRSPEAPAHPQTRAEEPVVVHLQRRDHPDADVNRRYGNGEPRFAPVADQQRQANTERGHRKVLGHDGGLIVDKTQQDLRNTLRPKAHCREDEHTSPSGYVLRCTEEDHDQHQHGQRPNEDDEDHDAFEQQCLELDVPRAAEPSESPVQANPHGDSEGDEAAKCRRETAEWEGIDPDRVPEQDTAHVKCRADAPHQHQIAQNQGHTTSAQDPPARHGHDV